MRAPNYQLIRAESIRRNRTFSGDPHTGLHTAQSRREDSLRAISGTLKRRAPAAAADRQACPRTSHHPGSGFEGAGQSSVPCGRSTLGDLSGAIPCERRRVQYLLSASSWLVRTVPKTQWGSGSEFAGFQLIAGRWFRVPLAGDSGTRTTAMDVSAATNLCASTLSVVRTDRSFLAKSSSGCPRPSLGCNTEPRGHAEVAVHRGVKSSP